MHYQFHVNVLAKTSDKRFSVTWEYAAGVLEGLPRMIFEPDGSFVISGGVGGERWQVDGHLFDFDDRLQRMELHGACPAEEFDRLLRAVGWPDVELEFQMVREGTTHDEAEFRKVATIEA